MGNDCVFVSEVKKKSALNDSRTASNVINNIDKIDLLQNHYITPDVDKSSLCTSDSNIIIDHSDVEPINKIGTFFIFIVFPNSLIQPSKLENALGFDKSNNIP